MMEHLFRDSNLSVNICEEDSEQQPEMYSSSLGRLLNLSHFPLSQTLRMCFHFFFSIVGNKYHTFAVLYAHFSIIHEE